MARTNFRLEAELNRILRRQVRVVELVKPRTRLAKIRVPLAAETRMRERRTPATETLAIAGNGNEASRRVRARAREPRHNESGTPVHSAPGRNIAADVRHSAGGNRSLSAAASFRSAGSGLPHDSGNDLLSRRRSHSHGLVGHCPVGAPIWSSARTKPDDLHQFPRQLSNYTAI